MARDRVINTTEKKTEKGEDDGGLRDDDASAFELIDDIPRVAEPCELGGDKSGSKGEQAEVLFVARLGDDVTTGAIANDEGGDDGEDGVIGCGKKSGGGGAEEYCHERLDFDPEGGGAGFNQNEPDSVKGSEQPMCEQKIDTGNIGEQDETDTNDDVDEIRLKVKEPVARADGEHAPF